MARPRSSRAGAQAEGRCFCALGNGSEHAKVFSPQITCTYSVQLWAHRPPSPIFSPSTVLLAGTLGAQASVLLETRLRHWREILVRVAETEEPAGAAGAQRTVG